MDTFFEVLAEIVSDMWDWFKRDPIDNTITICVCLLISSCTIKTVLR